MDEATNEIQLTMDKTEKKTVDEILTGQLSGMSVRIPTVLLKHVSNAMNEYAAQELAEYKARLKEELSKRISIIFPSLYDNGKQFAYEEIIDLIYKL